ncbi:DUF1937 family protein [Enterovirga sp. GCM10030262]|uniref:DUF1937 family protein n=1 Tax=Enterovirga sp. GCM10030262 TaxID=3273391 RepID=UPI00360F8426
MTAKSHEIIYLACPYSHPNMDVRVARFEASAHAAADLIHRGRFVYSPITMTHPIDLVMAAEGETMGSDYWCDFDEAFMRVCSEMIILAIPGWDQSRGIQREAKFFAAHGKPVRYLIPASDGSYTIADSLDQHDDGGKREAAC